MKNAQHLNKIANNGGQSYAIRNKRNYDCGGVNGNAPDWEEYRLSAPRQR